MRIRKGVATDYARQKVDVEVDETDLARLCTDSLIDPAVTVKITGIQTYLLLDTWSEWLILAESVKLASEADRPGVQARAEQARQAHYATVDNVREELGLPRVYSSPSQAAAPQ